MIRLPSVCCGLLVVLNCLLGCQAAFAQPALTRAVPSAVVPGQTTELTLHGSKLEGATQVWTSFGGQVELVAGGTGTQVVCKITLPATAPLGVGPVGVGGLMLSTPAGVSDVLLVAIDDLPAVVDSGKNHGPETAQSLDWPVAIDGVGDSALSDYYQVQGKAGQRIAAEVLASRIDSALDPVLRLLDAEGRELAISDDEPGLAADCRLEYTFASDGAYLLQIHDNRHQGGGAYRLRVGDFPLVSTPLPLAARRGSTRQLRFAAEPGSEAATMILTVPGNPDDTQWGVAARLPGGKASAMTSLLISELPEHVEREPNDEEPSPTLVSLPAAVSGLLQAAGDRDRYAFVATEGQPLRLRAVAGQLGSPAVPKLTVFSADGKKLAETSFSQVGDQTVSFSAPADGIYELQVEELLGRGGPSFSYRVELQSPPPFSLALKNDKGTSLRHVLGSGGTVTLDIVCERNGYEGPIALSIPDAADKFQLFHGIIPEKAKEAKLLVAPTADWTPGDLHVVRIVGSATIDGRSYSASMSTAAVLQAQRPRLVYPPAWLDGRVALARSGAAASAPYTIQLEPAEIVFARPLQEAVFHVQPTRSNKEFKEPLEVVVPDLPEGFTAEVKREGEGEAEKYAVTLKGPADVPLSTNPIRVLALASFKGQGFLVEETGVLNVMDPLGLQLEVPAALDVGKSLAVTLRVVRRGDDPQPVVVRFPELPAGVTVGGDITLTPEETEKQIELTAAADAPAAVHPLVATATTQYRGREVQVRSTPISLTINKP